MIKRRYTVYIVIVMVLLLCGCAKKESPEEYAVKVAVTKYNNAIIDLYKTVSPEKLNEIALEEESKKVQSYMSIFLAGKRLMEAEYQKIEFREVIVEGDSATVKTSEDWTFRWIHFKTGEEIEPWTDIHYEMQYDLTLIDGKWMIAKATDIEKAEEAALENKGEAEKDVIATEPEPSLDDNADIPAVPEETELKKKPEKNK